MSEGEYRGVEGRPLCAKGFHFLDLEGSTYTLKDGRTRCTECKKSRAKRSREKAKQKKESAERRARLRDEQKAAAKKPKPKPSTPETVLNPAVPTMGTLGREAAALHRHALMVRASRRT